jgi:hypothetical protein
VWKKDDEKHVFAEKIFRQAVPLKKSMLQAVTEGKVLCIERSVFQQIMVSTGIRKMENQVRPEEAIF